VFGILSKSPVKCPECGSANWERVYTNDYLEDYDDLTQFKLMKEVKCLDCLCHWSLSTIDIIRHFMYLKKKEGKSKKEIKEEMNKDFKEFLKGI